MRPQPKILWNAKDAPWLPSGYGIITRYLTPLLGEHYGKENVLIMAPVYQRDSVGEYRGMRVLPGVNWSFGEEVLLDHYQNHGCNILLQVGDAWPLGVIPDLAAQDKILYIHWVPVDWLGMPKNILNRIRYAHKLIPFSKDGEARLRKGGLTNVEPTIWLGLDTELWRPVDRETLPRVMQSLGYEYDTFNILIVAANQERKNIRQQLEGIQLFWRENGGSNPRLYIHSIMRGERDLLADLDELGLSEITRFPDPYTMMLGGFPEEKMVAITNCADVLLNCCMEGFGLPQLQAQACGVPVVTLSEGPGPELVISGVQVPPMGVVTSRNMMTIPIAHPAGIAHGLEVLWQRRMEKGVPLRSEKAVEFVRENFGWGKIAEQWFRVIDSVMEDRERYCWDMPEAGGELRQKANETYLFTGP